MFSSEISINAMRNIIDKLLYIKESQVELDNLYGDVINKVTEEMKAHVPFINSEYHCKKDYRKRKKFWNNDLNDKWKNVYKCEKEMRCFRGSDNRMRNMLRIKYKNERRKFDKALRFYERRYKKGLLLKIEECETKNPKKFWNYLKNLGPKTGNKIPEEVFVNENETSNVKQVVMEHWKNEFKKLYNPMFDDKENERFFGNINRKNLWKMRC
jgi:hypothetical protein